MQALSLNIIKGVPTNLALGIFLAGFLAGVVIAIFFFSVFSGGGGGARGKEETPHDIIMAIKKRAAGSGGGLTFFGAVGTFLMIILLFVFVLAIVVFGRYWSEGRPGGEQFIPYFLRMFVFPLQERFPFLTGM